MLLSILRDRFPTLNTKKIADNDDDHTLNFETSSIMKCLVNLLYSIFSIFGARIHTLCQKHLSELLCSKITLTEIIVTYSSI